MGNSTYHKRGKKVDGYDVRNHPNYNVWSGMKSRCDNDKSFAHGDYGARGISYAPHWVDFENFCKDMGIRPSPHHSLERVDNNGGYRPGNCIWADRFTQAANRRTFKNNTTGVRGVTKNRLGRYVARCQIENKRFKLAGTFETAELAEEELLKFYALYRANKTQAFEKMLERKPRFDSSTGVRGISRHQDGGYMVRATKDGVREYIGYFKNLDEAKKELEKWKQGQK